MRELLPSVDRVDLYCTSSEYLSLLFCVKLLSGFRSLVGTCLWGLQHPGSPPHCDFLSLPVSHPVYIGKAHIGMFLTRCSPTSMLIIPSPIVVRLARCDTQRFRSIHYQSAGLVLLLVLCQCIASLRPILQARKVPSFACLRHFYRRTQYFQLISACGSRTDGQNLPRLLPM